MLKLLKEFVNAQMTKNVGQDYDRETVKEAVKALLLLGMIERIPGYETSGATYRTTPLGREFYRQQMGEELKSEL